MPATAKQQDTQPVMAMIHGQTPASFRLCQGRQQAMDLSFMTAPGESEPRAWGTQGLRIDDPSTDCYSTRNRGTRMAMASASCRATADPLRVAPGSAYAVSSIFSHLVLWVASTSTRRCPSLCSQHRMQGQ